MDNDEVEVFWIRATRCKRCGGILVSEKAVKLGYGCVCYEKARPRTAEPDPDQMTFDELED